ncbi:CHAT domain-containing protein, partial [Aquimarina spinulae]
MQKIQLTFSVFLFWITFFTILSYSTYAQVTNDTLIASQYFKKADSLLIDKKYDSSIEFFSKALPIYKNAKTWERLAACYNGISENQWRNRKLEEALSSAKKVLEINSNYIGKNTFQEARAYDNIGNYYQGIPNYDKALPYFQKALKIKQKLFHGNHPDIAISYGKLAIIHYYISDYQEAIRFQKKVLEINLTIFGAEHQKTANAYNNIGVFYDSLGKDFKALEYYKKNLAIIIKKIGENHLQVGHGYTNIGTSYSDLRQDDNALNYYQKALAIYTEKEDLKGLSVTYVNIGVVLINKGEYDKALQYFKKSLHIRLDFYGKHHPKVADVYMNIGVNFRDIKKYDKALQYYSKGLQIYKDSYGKNNDKVANIYTNIGNVYTDKGEYDTALNYLKKALEIRSTIFDKNNFENTKSYKNIGDLYLKKGEYDNALLYYQKNLSILQNEYGEQHMLTVDSYIKTAITYKELKEYPKALFYFNKALLNNIKNDDKMILENTFDPNYFFESKLLLEALHEKAKTLQLQYLKNNNIKELDQSIIVYKKADILISHIRQSFQNYQDKVWFAKQTKEIYKDAIKAQLLYKNKQDPKPLEKAIHYVEKSKANTLKELLNTSVAKNFVGLPEDLVALEKELRTNRSFYQSKITEEQSEKEIDTSKVTYYENKLFDINRRQDSLTENLEKNYPKYHQLKYKNDVISAGDIQQQLDDMTTVVEFFTEDSTTYAFTISKHEINVQELSTPKLTKQIEAFRKSIIAKNTGVYKQQAYALYNTLIAPIKDKLVGDQLIIIPDGPLWHLNFELILTQKDDSNNPALLSYLLKEYAVTYANAATLLFNSFKSDPETKPLQECLAFSFSDSTQTTDSRTMSMATLRDAGDDLPGTRKEIKAISDIIDGQYYFGSQAIEANFKSNAGQYNILHLALHGEVDNERPENSKLYFTKSKDTIEDNLLYSHELFALDIPAELTVLSACNTGSGKIAKGEGIMSLGTAFRYAGTKSLLLTSWEVSDQTTPEL